MQKKRGHKLKIGARLTLFLVSYLPLFIIIIFLQVHQNREFLKWDGMGHEPIIIYVKHFGAASVAGALSVFGVVGLVYLVKNMRRRAESGGELVEVVEIENKNNESISYLFTYLIPFVFQDLSSLPSVFAVVMLLAVTFLIYSNSSMLLINPTLSIRYAIYAMKYQVVGAERTGKGMVICKNKYLEEGDRVKVAMMGHGLYYAFDMTEGGTDGREGKDL